MTALLLAAALALQTARADPLALRHTGVEGAAAGVLGLPLSSVGGWQGDWGLALSSRDLAMASLEGARRWRGDQGRNELQLSLGLGALWLEPGMSGHLGMSLLRRAEGGRVGWTGSLSLPASLRLLGTAAPGPVEARLPLLLGNQLGYRAGDLWLGPVLELGLVVSPGRPLATAGQLGFAVGGPALARNGE